jgi:hypothetical protein
MNKETIKPRSNEASNIIEDLTVDETAAQNVKGGPSDYLLELDGIKGESATDRRSPVRGG